jgi:hypothetical protein
MSAHWLMNNWTLFLTCFSVDLCFFFLEFPCGRCLVPHLLSILWSKYVDHEMPTIEYQATSQISTSCTLINFCLIIIGLLYNLLRTSKMKALMFSKEKFQTSLRTMNVFSHKKYWQQFKPQQTLALTLRIDLSLKILSIFNTDVWASKSSRF